MALTDQGLLHRCADMVLLVANLAALATSEADFVVLAISAAGAVPSLVGLSEVGHLAFRETHFLSHFPDCNPRHHLH